MVNFYRKRHYLLHNYVLYAETGVVFEIGHDLERVFFQSNSGERLKYFIDMISDNFSFQHKYLYFSPAYRETSEDEMTCANQPYLP